MTAQASRIWKSLLDSVVFPRLLGLGLVLGIVSYLLFASQSGSYLPFASQSANYSVVSDGGTALTGEMNIVTARGESITWNIQLIDAIPGYWASDTGLVLTLDGVSPPLTILHPKAAYWDQNGSVYRSLNATQQDTTITTTFTIPSTMSGPEQRSLSGTLAGTIVYPVEGPSTSSSPFGTYDDHTLNVSIPVHLQLVSQWLIPWINGQLPRDLSACCDILFGVVIIWLKVRRNRLRL